MSLAGQAFRNMRNTSSGLNSIVMEVSIPSWPKDLAERNFNRITKQAMREMIELHYRYHIPAHFRHDAAQVYKYKPRTAKYMKYKARKYGHQRPLEKTGASKRRILADGVIRVGGTGVAENLNGTLTVKFDWNRKIYKHIKSKYEKKAQGHAMRLYNKFESSRMVSGVTPEVMRQEMRQTTSTERRYLALKFRSKVIAEINAAKKTSRRKTVKTPV